MEALAKFKCTNAVPTLISHLGHPQTTANGLDLFEAETLLEALLEIGDKRAIAAIEKYLSGENPPESKAVARRMLAQLKSADPVEPLLDLLAHESDEPEQAAIIEALAKYRSPRVTAALTKIAGTSDSAFLRREAIVGLANLGDRSSLLGLTSLLSVKFPKDLKAQLGWKGKPDFPTYFPETIVELLRDRTKQDFGKDQAKWEEWVKANVKRIGTESGS